MLFTCLTSHKRFKTEAKNTSEPLYQRVNFGGLNGDSSAAFGQIHDGILCVSTPIVGEWRRSGRYSVGDGGNRSPACKNFKGKLERFNTRIPLVACLLDIEKRPHCEI